MKRVKTLSPGEIEIIQKGMIDPDYITGYFFKTPDREQGFYFDNNFTPEGAWQKIVHNAIQSLIVVIGGVGTGKTLGVGMSAATWCVLTDGFKFLNVAQKEWQARLMYDLILDFAENTPFQGLIIAQPQRPYPKIVISYRIGNRVVRSSMEFMSVDKDARGIFSWRGDWINVEEAGLLDNLDEISMNLASRLTGSTPKGRAFLGRFSFISNPWDTPHLWYLSDMAASDPENNLSIVVSTYDNKNVTEKQITNLLKHIPVEERPRFLAGLRPEGKGSYFSKEAIYRCEDPVSAELSQKAFDEGKTGYSITTLTGAGVVGYETPWFPGRVYFVVGDPGTEAPPGRNAPVIAVWDMTDFPYSPMTLISFWWGSGFGRITPFVDKLMDWKERYHAFFTGIDSTGPQKSLSELLNIQFYNSEDPTTSENGGITGLDFSGPRKASYLVALRLLIENVLMRWPKFIVGFRAQLANYDPLKDHAGLPKIPQDIVAMLAMAAFAARAYYGIDFEDFLSARDKIAPEDDPNLRVFSRLHQQERSKRSPTRSDATQSIKETTL